MDKLKTLLLSVILGLAILIPTAAMAAQIETGDSLTLQEDQTIEDNYLIFGNFITIKGTVKGDLFAFGSNVDIDGVVEGNVFAGAGNVKISGEIGKDIFVGAGNVEIGDKARIGQDSFIGAGNVKTEGEVGRDLTVGAGKVSIMGNILGNAKISNDEISFDQNSPAKINGDFTYYGEKEIDIPDEVKIGGNINFRERSKDKKVGLLAIAGGRALGIAMAAILGLIIVLVFPKKSLEVNKTMRESFWRSLGIGFVFLVVIPVAAIILLASILGIPLALILMGIYGLILYLGKVFAALFVGRLLTGENWHLVWSLILGLVLIAIVGLIPFVGPIAVFILFLLSLGAMTTVAQKTYVELRKEL